MLPWRRRGAGGGRRRPRRSRWALSWSSGRRWSGPPCSYPWCVYTWARGRWRGWWGRRCNWGRGCGHWSGSCREASARATLERRQAGPGWRRRGGAPGTWRGGRPRCWGRWGRPAWPGERSRWGRMRGQAQVWLGHRWWESPLRSRRCLYDSEVIIWTESCSVLCWNIYLTRSQEIILTAGPAVARRHWINFHPKNILLGSAVPGTSPDDVC